MKCGSNTFLKCCPQQTVDKKNEFRQFDESFGQAFSKACAVEAAEASSRSAEREISPRRFLFDSANLRSNLRRACEPLFICAYIVKEKATKKFVHCYKLYAFRLHLGATLF